MVRNQIPNILTLFNLLMGCCALYFVFTQQFMVVFILLLLALLADVFDGMVARWLKVDGGLGKQLDSLADVVSFGVVPGAVLFQLIRYAVQSEQGQLMTNAGIYLGFTGFIFTLGSALRLARFNIDTRQTTEFIGLATPASSMVILGLMMMHRSEDLLWRDYLNNTYVLIFLAVILFLLMNAPIRMFSLKSFKTGWKGNELPIIFSVSCLPLVLWLKGKALFFLPFVYVILSLIIFRKK